MKIVEVKYGRKFNLGDYNSEEIALTATLGEDEDTDKDALEAVAKLKELVSAAHVDGTVNAEELDGEEEEEDPKPKTKKAKSKKKKPVEEEEEEEEIEEEEEEEEETEEEEEETETISAKKAKGKKGLRSKPVTYDRESEVHKKIFGEKVTELFPKWKKDEKIKAKRGAASRSLEGTPFLDAEGEVLPEFIKALKAKMK